MLLRAKIRMGESDLTAFEARLFTDGTLQRTSSSPTLAHDTSHASASSCSSRSKKSSRSEGQRHKPAVKQWVHYPEHLIAALWCFWSRLKGWEEHRYEGEKMAVCALHCSGRTRRALGGDPRSKLGMISRLASSWKHVFVASECKTGLQRAEECEYSHPPFIFITFLAWLYTSLSLTYMLYRSHRLLKAFCASFFFFFLSNNMPTQAKYKTIHHNGSEDSVWRQNLSLFGSTCIITEVISFFWLLEVVSQNVFFFSNFLAWTYLWIG